MVQWVMYSLEFNPAHSTPHPTLGESLGKHSHAYTHASVCIYWPIMPITCICHRCWSLHSCKVTDNLSIMLAPRSINIMVPHGFSWKSQHVILFSNQPHAHAYQLLAQLIWPLNIPKRGFKVFLVTQITELQTCASPLMISSLFKLLQTC